MHAKNFRCPGIALNTQNDKIAWYENTDGLGSFGTQQVITTTAFGARSVYAADLDGDDDIDVLSASFENDKIAWYENTGGGPANERMRVSVGHRSPRKTHTTNPIGPVLIFKVLRSG